jgi:hypothetical protein
MPAWLVMNVESEASLRPIDCFHRFCEIVVARLPLGLNSIVPPTFLGFVVINGATFAFDLVLLTLLHGGLGIALPVAVTVGLRVRVHGELLPQPHPELPVTRRSWPAIRDLHVQRDALGGVPALNAHRVSGMPNTSNSAGSRNTVSAAIPSAPGVSTCIACACIAPDSSRR